MYRNINRSAYIQQTKKKPTTVTLLLSGGTRVAHIVTIIDISRITRHAISKVLLTLVKHVGKRTAANTRNITLKVKLNLLRRRNNNNNMKYTVRAIIIVIITSARFQGRKRFILLLKINDHRYKRIIVKLKYSRNARK